MKYIVDIHGELEGDYEIIGKYEEIPQGDLISRNALKKDFKERLAKCDEWIEKAKDKETRIRASTVKAFIAEVIMTIDNAPTVETKTTKEKTAGEMVETKHRLNLLIGVLYSNQLISENDLEYIEDSIKELMKGGAE